MEQTLGKRISSHRKRLGMTQDQLAEKLGVTPQAVSKWENDQSCPDINTLPRLADLFGISVDVLLGREPEAPVYESEVVNDTASQTDDIHFQKGTWEFSWDSGRRNALTFALFVLLVGCLTLADTLLDWDVSFWGILWPSALLMLGVRQLLGRFTFLSLGFTVLGGYWLLENLDVLQLHLGFRLVLPITLVLFGLSLLADALRKKNRKSTVHINHNGKAADETKRSSFAMNGDAFNCETSFGSNHHLIQTAHLQNGHAECNFGELTVDLSGVKSIGNPCSIHADCNFGKLTLLVPQCYAVDPKSETVFAGFNVVGEPQNPIGTIQLYVSVNFGEIEVRYI